MNKKTISQNVMPLATLPCRPVRVAMSLSRAAAKSVAGSAMLMIKTLMAMAVMVGLTASATAQTVAYTANALTSYGGASTSGPLNMGQIFQVNGAGIEVFQLGFFDYQGQPLAGSHTVTLFTNQTAIASVTVPAGSATNLLNGYAFAALSTPIYLPAGSYTVLAYGVDTADPYGEGSDGNVGFNGSANLSAVNTCFDFTAQGSPDYPGGPGDTGSPWSLTWGDPSADASFTYTNAVWPNSTWTGAVDANWSTTGNWNPAPVFPTALTFAGSTHLTNNNDNTGITVDSLTFDADAGAFVLNGNDITLSGSIGFNGNPATPITQTVNLNMAWSASETIDTPTNGNLALGGGITSSSDTSLIKLDAGTLTLGGTNTIASWDINGGITTITGDTTINGDGNSRIYVGDGDALANCNGTLVIQPGAALSILGNYGDDFVIGRDGGSGTVVQNGGTFTFDSNRQNMWLGATSFPGTTSEYDMNGGLLDMSFNNIGMAGSNNGVDATAKIIQTGGVITNVNQMNLSVVFGGSGGNGISTYTLSGGSLYFGGANGFTAGTPNYAINLGGGTVGAEVSWSSPLNMTLTGSNGPVTFNPGGNTITLSGVLSGNGGLTVAGGGILEFSAANSYTGDTAVNTGSILQLDTTGSSFGAFHLANDALLNLNFSGTYAVAGCYTNGVALPVGTYNAGNLPAFITGSGNLQVASSISTGFWTGLGADSNWSTAGNWDQNAVPVFPIGLTFAGSTRLLNTNDLSSITVSSMTFDAAAGAFVLNGNDITLNGNIGFNGNPVAPITQTVNLNMAWSIDKTINTPTNGNLTLGGNINTSANNLTKIGAGKLALGGINSFAGFSDNGGTVTITGNTMVTGTGGNDIYLGNGDALANCNGTLVIQPGAALSILGNYGDDFVIGRDGGSGTVVQNGGTFTFDSNRQNMWLGATSFPGTTSEYDMNGGLLDMSFNNIGMAGSNNGVDATAKIIQTGGVITNVNQMNLSVVFGGSGGNGISTYTLSGGSLYFGGANGFTAGTPNYAINLGGGTVGAEVSWSSPLNMTLTGSNGPVTFNPGGNTITLSGVLSGNGGLTVTNGGTLELSGTNTYTGDTIVHAGTALQLDVPGTALCAFRVANGALLNLNYAGSLTVPACYTNGVALASGVYTAANLPGFINGTGSLTVSVTTPPVVHAPVISGGNLILTGSGGNPGAGYTWLSSTNVTTPIASWTVSTTGTFDGSGDFSNAIPVSTSTPATFFRLRTP
jgi:autotransporter-associated beta strand protein